MLKPLNGTSNLKYLSKDLKVGNMILCPITGDVNLMHYTNKR